MNDKTRRWLEIAEYDFETAKAMLETKRYLYVGFMCHQVVEKILKGYYCKLYDNEPPYIHNLIRLAELTHLNDGMSVGQNKFLTVLNPLNVAARYSSYKEQMLKSLNAKRCEEILKDTEVFITWIKNKLSE